MLTACINDPFLPDGTARPAVQPALQHQFRYTFKYMPGITTYLDTPVMPIAAFAFSGKLPGGRRVPERDAGLGRVDGTGNGPWVANVGNIITITSLGTADSVKNPNFGQAGQPQLITRDFGFGGVTGAVTIGGNPATVTGWSATTITVQAPNSGQLVVTRGDNGKSSVVGIYVTVEVH